MVDPTLLNSTVLNTIQSPEAIDVLGLDTLIQTVQPIIVKLSVLLGGVFGLYLILILVRVYFEHKKVKILKQIRFDLDQQNIHNNLLYSKKQKGPIKKLWSKIFK